MPTPKDSPESRLRSLNEEFLNDMDEDPKGHGVVKPGDESSPDEDDEEIDDTESDDEESEEEGEEDDSITVEEEESEEDEEKSDDDDDEEDSLDDLLLTDEERNAKKSGKKSNDDDDADFLTDDEKLILQEFNELKQDPKLGKHVERLSTRLKGIAARENEVVNVLRELGTDIRSLGLTPDDLNDRNWTQKVVARIREQTIRELTGAGVTPKQKTTQTQTQQTDELQLDDDDIVTGAEVKQLLNRELSKRLAPVDQIVNERMTTQQKALFDDVFEHHWKSNPLLRELSKDKEQGVKLKERAKASFGSDYAALLGKDGSGMTIKSNLDEFANLLRHGIRSARSTSSGDGDAKKGSRGPITRKGGNAPSRKITKLPPATMKQNGRVFKRSPDERLAEFNEAFNDELGYGG